MCLNMHIRPDEENNDVTSHYLNTTYFLNCSININYPQCLSWEIDTSNFYHPVLRGFADLSEDDWPNFSEYDFPTEIWGHKPVWEITLKILAFLPFVVMGIFGNVLIIYAVVNRCVVRTSTNLLLANMAAADLATLLICPPMFICAASFQNYIMGKPGCKMEGFINCAFLLTAVLNVTAVSYDRLTAVVLPHEARLNQIGTYVIMFGTWFVGIACSAPFIVYRRYKERQWANFLEKYCTENTAVLSHYWNVVIALLVWVPLAVMVACYTGILIKLHYYEQEVLSREAPRTIKWKVRVIRTTFIVLVVFVLCRVPYTALIFWRSKLLSTNKRNQLVDEHFLVLWFISRYLIYINAAINPFIYGFSNENFKRALRSMGVCRWLFSGRSGSSNVTLSPQKKHKKLEKVQQEIYHPGPKEQLAVQHCPTPPLEGKPKTESSECYI